MREGRVAVATILGILAVGSSALASSDPACPLAAPLPSAEVLVGYVGNLRQTGATRVGAFRTLGSLRGATFVPSDGASIRDGMSLWQVLSPTAPPSELQQASSFLDRMGEDHCVFHAEVAQVPKWTILSSRPIGEVFRRPSEADRSYFADHHDVCVDQGDYPAADKPPCSKPKLLAISNIEGRGVEYWATEPYRWDTGITIWKRTPSGLSRTLSACPGCSD